MELKLQLIQLKNQKIEYLSNEGLKSLVDNMLDNIGSVDPELRDKLIYPTFIRIIDKGLLTAYQYQYILEVCLDDNHLFFKIGEENTDSVFTRSFSSLVITGILLKDSQVGLLSEENLKNAFKKCVYYLKSERDTRGYVEGKGWAHSIAHGADLLVSLVRHPRIKDENFIEILNTLHNSLFKDAIYIDDEDERLIFVIEALMEKNVDEEKLKQWVLQIFNDLDSIFENEGFSNKFFRTKFNIANFLKTLYFRIGFKNDECSIRELINEKLKELHHKLYGS